MRLLIALLLCLVPALADAATLVVSPSGSETANCVKAPCRQIQQASDLAEPGDTVLITDGVYNGFSVASSGTATKPITFAAEHQCKAQVTASVRIEGKSYIAVSGLNVKAQSGNVSGSSFDVRGVGQDITLENNCAYSPSESCAAIWGVPWKSDPGVHNYQALRNIRIVGNKFLKCNNGGWNEGITVANGVDGVLIQSNEVGDAPGDIANGANGGEGIDLKAGVHNAKIYSNWIHNRPHLCIYIDGNGPFDYYATAPEIRGVEIAYNRITDCGDTAIQLSTEAAGNVNDVKVHDNTIDGTKAGFGVLVYRHPNAATWAAPLPPGCVKNAEIHNNKITRTAKSATSSLSPCSTGIVFSNNSPTVAPALPPSTPPTPPPSDDHSALKGDLSTIEAEAAILRQHLTALDTAITQAKSRLP